MLLDNQFWQQGDGSLWIVWDLIEEMFPAGLVDAMAAALRTAIELLAGTTRSGNGSTWSYFRRRSASGVIG
ncbi:hypothetical protein NKG94_49230 [Micromonospora sp. M12]